MPLYEYQCKKCGYIFEKIQSFSDPPVKKCPKCKGTVEQLLSAPAVQFKGTGWYVTDYASKSGAKPAADTSEKSKPDSSTASETTKRETTPPKQTESKSKT